MCHKQRLILINPLRKKEERTDFGVPEFALVAKVVPVDDPIWQG